MAEPAMPASPARETNRAVWMPCAVGVALSFTIFLLLTGQAIKEDSENPQAGIWVSGMMLAFTLPPAIFQLALFDKCSKRRFHESLTEAGRKPHAVKHLMWSGVELSLSYAVIQFSYELDQSVRGISTALLSAYPCWMAAICYFRLNEKLSRKQLCCAALVIASLVSVTLVSSGGAPADGEEQSTNTKTLFALFLGLLSGILLAIGDVELKIAGMEDPFGKQKRFEPEPVAERAGEPAGGAARESAYGSAPAGADPLVEAKSAAQLGVRSVRSANTLIFFLHAAAGLLLIGLALILGDQLPKPISVLYCAIAGPVLCLLYVVLTVALRNGPGGAVAAVTTISTPIFVAADLAIFGTDPGALAIGLVALQTLAIGALMLVS